jgi:3-oxoadipate enol-lactonase
MTVVSRQLAFSDDGTGRPIVLLHPVGLTHASWRDVIGALADSHRVIAPDFAGHGGSDGRTPLEIGGLADDVIALVDALDAGPVTLVGLSLGGAVAIAVAQRRPDLVGALLVVNSAAGLPEPAAVAVRDRAVATRADYPAFARQTVERWFTPAFHTASGPVVARTSDELLTADAEVVAACWEALAATDLTEGLRSMVVPTTVVTGSEDPAAPLGALTATRIPGCRHLHLEGFGHLGPLEDPAGFAGIIRSIVPAT